MRPSRRDLLAALLLAVLPALAYAPALLEGRLLGPGDGAALHFPLRMAVWESWRQGDLPAWNHDVFLGAPLLGSYRPGALFPPMVALSLFPSFLAFQLLVLASLGAAGALTYAYLRQLGAEPVGAYVGGLCFSLGPYLVGHLGDTATVTAAPLLPLVLLALEAVLRAPRPGNLLAVAATVALLVLAGSPEAARAGAALFVGRLLVGVVGPRRPAAALAAGAALLGVALAAPQLFPALAAAADAGRSITGLASPPGTMPGGFTGLVLRYASHTPAAALAIAAVPLLLRPGPVRPLAAALAVALGLQWGQPLAAPGALPLAFDFMLCVLAGLSLSAQWRNRRAPEGRRLRGWFLAAALASSAALSVAAAVLGPLPESLAPAVGVLALALILYFPQSSSPRALKAALWLAPLTLSFLLQPAGRATWRGTPTAALLYEGTSTRQAIDRALGARPKDRSLALVFDWPSEWLYHLAYGNLAIPAGRRTANGYDPLVPLRTRAALGGMSVGGVLPRAFARTRAARLELLGLRWVQVPTAALRGGGGELPDLRLLLEPGERRAFPLPGVVATEVLLASCLRGPRPRPPGALVAWLEVRLATGRTLDLPVRAGMETGGTEEGDCREAAIPLRSRYRLDGVGLRMAGSRPRLLVWSVAVRDALRGDRVPVSRTSAFLSEGGFREAAATPWVRLFELPHTAGPAHVVERVRALSDEGQVLFALDVPPELGIDPRKEAVAAVSDLAGIVLPEAGRSGRAELLRDAGSRLDVRGEGPGVLVVAAAWDEGWSAQVDGRPARILRVNHAQMGVVLDGGRQRVTLRYRPRGFTGGVVAAALAIAILGAAASGPGRRLLQRRGLI